MGSWQIFVKLLYVSCWSNFTKICDKQTENARFFAGKTNWTILIAIHCSCRWHWNYSYFNQGLMWSREFVGWFFVGWLVGSFVRPLRALWFFERYDEFDFHDLWHRYSQKLCQMSPFTIERSVPGNLQIVFARAWPNISSLNLAIRQILSPRKWSNSGMKCGFRQNLLSANSLSEVHLPSALMQSNVVIHHTRQHNDTSRHYSLQNTPAIKIPTASTLACFIHDV